MSKSKKDVKIQFVKRGFFDRRCKQCEEWKPPKDFMTEAALICTNCQMKRFKSILNP